MVEQNIVASGQYGSISKLLQYEFATLLAGFWCRRLALLFRSFLIVLSYAERNVFRIVWFAAPHASSVRLRLFAGGAQSARSRARCAQRKRLTLIIRGVHHVHKLCPLCTFARKPEGVTCQINQVQSTS